MDYRLEHSVRRLHGAAVAELERDNDLVTDMRLTGLPLWRFPTRREIAPYVHENTIECWLSRRDLPHASPGAQSEPGPYRTEGVRQNQVPLFGQVNSFWHAASR